MNLVYRLYIAETNKRKGEVARGIAEEHAAQP